MNTEGGDEGEIETWRAGFLGRSAQDGTFLVELNPSEPVGLFQEVCLVNGETLSWDFYHAARGNGGADQTIFYEVVDSSGTVIQALDTNSLTPMGPSNRNNSNNAWDNVAGSATYTGSTGIHRLQFTSQGGGSNGNFLDDINIALVPIVAFENLTTSALEDATTGLPQFAISGVVPTTFDIQFAITGGTATQGADFTVSSNTLTIPAGTYDGSSADSIFLLPITILTDTLTEGSETIEITYDSATPASAAIIAGPNCTNAVTVATHTILDLPLVKAAAENFPPIDSTNGGVTGSVLASDTINGVPVDPSDVTLTVDASDPELTLNPDTGFITVAPNTPAGIYTVEYTICEDGNPSNCSTITETVEVFEAKPSLSMKKVASSEGPFTTGDVITYTYTITNDGDTTVSYTHLTLPTIYSV